MHLLFSLQGVVAHLSMTGAVVGRRSGCGGKCTDSNTSTQAHALLLSLSSALIVIPLPLGVITSLDCADDWRSFLSIIVQTMYAPSLSLFCFCVCCWSSCWCREGCWQLLLILLRHVRTQLKTCSPMYFPDVNLRSSRHVILRSSRHVHQAMQR